MRGLPLVLVVCAACGDRGAVTPESIASGGKDGQRVEVVGEVHTVTFDSTTTTARRALIAAHAGDRSLAWLLDDDDNTLAKGASGAYNDPSPGHPRTPDHYVLIRSVVPDTVTFGTPGFVATALKQAWGLGVHLTDIRSEER